MTAPVASITLVPGTAAHAPRPARLCRTASPGALLPAPGGNRDHFAGVQELRLSPPPLSALLRRSSGDEAGKYKDNFRPPSPRAAGGRQRMAFSDRRLSTDNTRSVPRRCSFHDLKEKETLRTLRL